MRPIKGKHSICERPFPIPKQLLTKIIHISAKCHAGNFFNLKRFSILV